MIVGWSDLEAYQGAVTMVDGSFDPLHAGHIAYFEAAASLGLPLLCNAGDDAYVRVKHDPLLPEDQRLRVLDAIRHVSFTHLNHTSTANVLRRVQPRYYVKGKDWEGRLPQEEVDACRELGIQIVFLHTVITSSTGLLAAYQSRLPKLG